MRSTTLALALALSLTSCDQAFKSHVLTETEQLRAKTGGLFYANQFNLRFVECFGTDSNGDKFITCTLASKDDPNAKPIEVSCSYTDSKSNCRKRVDGPLPRVESDR